MPSNDSHAGTWGGGAGAGGGGGAYRGVERRDGPVDSPRSPDSNQVWQLFRSLVPPEDDKIRRDELVARVRALVRRQWPEVELYQYGSTANDLCMRNADVDLCLILPRGHPAPIETVVEELGALLEQCTWRATVSNCCVQPGTHRQAHIHANVCVCAYVCVYGWVRACAVVSQLR
jgi:hypothetical protein